MSKFDKTIGDIADIFDGPHATPKKIESGAYYLSISSLNKGRLDLSQSAFISEKDFEKWTKRVTPVKGDILFSYETKLGEAALMPEGIQACLGRRMGILRPKPEKVISEYLLYAYLSPKFQQTIISNTVRGATVDRISLNVLPTFPIRIPPINEQKLIARLLVSLDSKIELNNKISKKLETLAKTIYDYWFIQFDFPNSKAKPYKSSGGKMVWSQELKMEIPYGWTIVNLKDILEFEKGTEPGSTEYITSQKNDKCIKFFRVGDIDGESSIYVDTTIKNYKIANERDIIVTFDGSVGKLGFGLNGAFSGGLRKIYDKAGKLDSSLIYFIFRDERIIATIHKYATGSILLHASSSIPHLKIPFNESEYTKYQAFVKPIFDQMLNIKRENSNISQLRDWLLPMLMNGQVSVKSS